LRNYRKILHKSSFAALVWAALFLSCREKIEIVNASLRPEVPTQIVHDFVTSYTDSAVLELRLKSPLMKYYGKQEVPYAEFEEGIEVFFHEGKDRMIGQISANYAKYIESKGLWEVRDNVVAINDEGEKLETELLFWDENKNLIYTDKYVRITQKDQIVMGNGLESDTNFDNWKIKNVTATLYIEDE